MRRYTTVEWVTLVSIIFGETALSQYWPAHSHACINLNRGIWRSLQSSPKCQIENFAQVSYYTVLIFVMAD